MDTIGIGSKRDVEAVVDEKSRKVTITDGAKRARQFQERARVEVFLAQLNCDRAAQADFVCGSQRSLADRRKVTLRREAPVRDEVELERDARVHPHRALTGWVECVRPSTQSIP